jgi:hypothetical protein
MRSQKPGGAGDEKFHGKLTGREAAELPVEVASLSSRVAGKLTGMKGMNGMGGAAVPLFK